MHPMNTEQQEEDQCITFMSRGRRVRIYQEEIERTKQRIEQLKRKLGEYPEVDDSFMESLLHETREIFQRAKALDEAIKQTQDEIVAAEQYFTDTIIARQKLELENRELNQQLEEDEEAEEDVLEADEIREELMYYKDPEASKQQLIKEVQDITDNINRMKERLNQFKEEEDEAVELIDLHQKVGREIAELTEQVVIHQERWDPKGRTYTQLLQETENLRMELNEKIRQSETLTSIKEKQASLDKIRQTTADVEEEIAKVRKQRSTVKLVELGPEDPTETIRDLEQKIKEAKGRISDLEDQLYGPKGVTERTVGRDMDYYQQYAPEEDEGLLIYDPEEDSGDPEYIAGDSDLEMMNEVEAIENASD